MFWRIQIRICDKTVGLCKALRTILKIIYETGRKLLKVNICMSDTNDVDGDLRKPTVF